MKPQTYVHITKKCNRGTALEWSAENQLGVLNHFLLARKLTLDSDATNLLIYPANTQRGYNVVTTSLERRDFAETL